MEIKEYKRKIEEEYKRISEVEEDKYRLHYHLMPLSGTLGDPNGMCQVDGVYHLYYVHSPIQIVENKRTPCVWAHVTTKDFIHYHQEPIAIYPDHVRDQDGVYSGSMLCKNGKFHAYYTGNVRYVGDYDYVLNGREQNVLLVSSDDGTHFGTKQLLMTNDDFPEDMTKHVRDPQVFEEDGKYYMILGARDLKDVGLALVYESDNLTDFHYMKRLETKNKFGYMWECPDLVAFDGQYVLICCPQGVEHEKYRFQNSHQCGYFVMEGDFKKDYTLREFEQFDYGFDLYAARTFLDEKGRRILVGWMGMSETDYGINRTTKYGWDQAVAMCRILTLKDGHIYQSPLPELKKLRKRKEVYDGQKTINLQGHVFELNLTSTKDQNLHITFRNQCILDYNKEKNELVFNMNCCGDGRNVRKLKVEKLENLQIFSDTSCLEIFVNDGYLTITTRIFEDDESIKVEPFEGSVHYYHLDRFKID